jgi:large subunit ribosomal protein L21
VTYAIFKAAGFQYRAELGDILRLPTLDAASGDTVAFDQVLLGAAGDEVLVGRPTVDGAVVRAEVLRHGRADKIVVFKFKRRKNYRRKTGHRQNFTEVRVSEIDLGGDRRVSLETEKQAKAAKPKRKTEAEPKSKAAAKSAEKKAAPKKPAAKRKTAQKKTAEKKTAEKKATAKKPAAKAKAKAAAKKPKAKAKDTAKSKKKKS